MEYRKSRWPRRKCRSCIPRPQSLWMALLSRSLKSLWIIVLALWLPCTMHCSLEAAGISLVECCFRSMSPQPEPDCHPTQSCEHCEVCSSVESGGYVKQDPSVDLKPFLAVAWLLVRRELLPPPVSTPDSSLRAIPLSELSPSWRFVARAALPPRAPSRVS